MNKESVEEQLASMNTVEICKFIALMNSADKYIDFEIGPVVVTKIDDFLFKISGLNFDFFQNPELVITNKVFNNGSVHE